MKKMFLMMMALVMNVAVVNAQNRLNVQERKGHKIEFSEQRVAKQADQLAKEMHLDRMQAAKFSKIYKDYKKDRMALRKQMGKKNMAYKHQAGKNQRNAKMQALDMKYRKQFAKVLNQKQVAYVMQHHKANNKHHKQDMHRGSRAVMHRMSQA